MAFKILSDGPPQGAGPGSVDDAHFLEALHGRAIQQAVHVAQGFLYALPPQIDLRIERSPATGPLTTGALGWAILLKSLTAGMVGQPMTFSGPGAGR